MPAPILETPRLRLRPHVLSDLDKLCDLLGTDRARYMGGPIEHKDAWRWVASEVASWELMGYGSWGIETKQGVFLGQISILCPPHFPEKEIGWTLLQAAEGQGFAAEAATAALHWAWAQGMDTLVSYIHPDNTRSIALAERLGAQRDVAAAIPDGETIDENHVYRHSPDTDGSPEAYA